MTLTEFLLARIAEDEDAAEHVNRGLWNSRVALLPPDLYGHISRQHPARVLAECKAKRGIVWRHSVCDDVSYGDDSDCPELRDLASVYADHPDCQPEWKP